MENNMPQNKSYKKLWIFVILILLVGTIVGGGLILKTKLKSTSSPTKKTPAISQSSIYFVPSTVTQNTPINSTQSAQLVVKPVSNFDALSIQFKFDPNIVKEVQITPVNYKSEKLQQYNIKSSNVDFVKGVATIKFSPATNLSTLLPNRGIKVATITYQLSKPLTKNKSLFTFTGRTAMLKRIDKTQVASTGNTILQSTTQLQYESILNSAPPLQVSQ